MIARPSTPPSLLAVASCGMLVCACGGEAPTPRIEAGYLTPTQADRIIARWPESVRLELLQYVYTVQGNRYVRACGKDPLRPLPPAQLSGEGFRLASHHGGDLSCALAEAGVYLLAERGARQAGPATLVTVVGGERVVEIDVERSPSGRILQVYGLYAPAPGRWLVLRPQAQVLGADRGAVTIDRIVSAGESLNVVRALLGRANFDLSAVGLGAELAPLDGQAIAQGDVGEDQAP